MNSEAAAFQAAQARHHHNMVNGKKQRYIEVFQCSGRPQFGLFIGLCLFYFAWFSVLKWSILVIGIFLCLGEDMNHVLTGGTNLATSSGSSPVKTTATNASTATTNVASLTNGLLPPGMFTPTATSQNTFGTGLDPNSAILAATQMQSPFFTFFPTTAPQQALLRPNPYLQLQLQQQQLMQQQLLQSQLAAQRLLASGQAAGQPSAQPMIGPRAHPPKRTFDQAFVSSDEAAKRGNFSNPTISAGPTTYQNR